MDYLYDGSFEGFLCCVYAHYYKEKAQGIYPEQNYQRSMLRAFFVVEAEVEKAERVYNAIQERISANALRRVYRAFLSSDETKEMKLLQYMRLGFQKGAIVDSLHATSAVYDVQQMEKKVANEQHRLLGLIRFSALQEKRTRQTDCSDSREILYAAIDPDHNVLELIADHFAERLKEETFILHDLKREKAVFCQKGRWYLGELPRDPHFIIAEDELAYRCLWKKYFETIAIEERKNAACQKRCMPVRYWKNLTEFR